MRKRTYGRMLYAIMAAALSLSLTGGTVLAEEAGTESSAQTEETETDTAAQTEEAETEAAAQTEEAETDTAAQTEEAETDAAAQTEETETGTAAQTEETETGTTAQDDAVGTMAFAKCNEYINIRSGADIHSEVVGKIYNHGAAQILDKEGDWYKIKSGNVEGYVSADYFAVGEEAKEIAQIAAYNVATVYPEVLMIRTRPDEASDVLDMAVQAQELEVVDWQGDWMTVALDADTYGFVNTNYVKYDTYYPVAETLQEERQRLRAEGNAAPAAEKEHSKEAELREEPRETEGAYIEDVQGPEDTYAEEPQQTEGAYIEDVQGPEDEYTEEPQETEGEYYEEPQQTEGAYIEDVQGPEGEYAEEPQQNESEYYEEPQQNESEYYEEPQQTEGEYYEEPQQTEGEYYEEPQQTEGEYYEEPQQTEGEYYEEQQQTEGGSYEEPSSGLGQQIADFAVQFVGNPYVYGGTSLTNGADCSGFVQSVFANFGIYLDRTAESQSYGGTPVDIGSIQPGDLLFYGDGYIGHVALYIGGGQIVHASTPESGIIISNYDYNYPACARRYWS